MDYQDRFTLDVHVKTRADFAARFYTGMPRGETNMGDDLRLIIGLTSGGALVFASIARFMKDGQRLWKPAIVLGCVGFLIVKFYPDAETDATARAAGFASLADKTAASAVGVSDAKTWAAKKPEIEAKEQAARLAKIERETQAIAEKAKAAGFDNPQDYIAAQSAGVADGATWKRRKAEDAFFKVPADQAAFVAAAVASKVAFRNAPNELAQGGTRAKRKAEMCSSLKGRTVTNWTGTIVELSSNGDGKGVLSVRIGDGVTVKTWNNAVSDIGDKTLIDPNSDLFSRLASMKSGQKVKFSGQFMSSDVDCVREASMTLAGSMMDPEFLMRFREARGM